MIQKTNYAYDTNTAENVLCHKVEFDVKINHVSTDCGRSESLEIVTVPAQTVQFHTCRTMTFPGWLVLTSVCRSTRHFNVEVECDLVSVVQDELGGFLVTYKVAHWQGKGICLIIF